jgi:hypothetical protein
MLLALLLLLLVEVESSRLEREREGGGVFGLFYLGESASFERKKGLNFTTKK